MEGYTELLQDLDISLDNSNRLPSRFSSDKMEIPSQTLSALRDGDYQAYDTIFKAYHTPIRHFLERMIHSEVDAQDITQEVFVNLWAKRERIDPEKNIKGFLYTTVKFFMLKYLKHQKVVDRYENYKIRDEVDFLDTPYDIAVGKELSLLIEISLARMPQQQAKVMRMKYTEGLSNEAIASALGISPETVKVHLKRGRAEIHKVLSLFVALFLTA
ncbi:MAG: RNA polymerase sigma-70 factor [Rikenellaceae bacterium]|jgi:RNA polymerase sigma-70 factor (ECF subfamily)|nr:RNA polymerase sigma-70 factor [Rikenellaceae bacterium]